MANLPTVVDLVYVTKITCKVCHGLWVCIALFEVHVVYVGSP